MFPRLARPPGRPASTASFALSSAAGRSSAKTVGSGGGSGSASAVPISIRFWLGLRPERGQVGVVLELPALDAHHLLPLRRHVRQRKQLRLEDGDRLAGVDLDALEFLLAPLDVDDDHRGVDAGGDGGGVGGLGDGVGGGGDGRSAKRAVATRRAERRELAAPSATAASLRRSAARTLRCPPRASTMQPAQRPQRAWDTASSRRKFPNRRAASTSCHDEPFGRLAIPPPASLGDAAEGALAEFRAAIDALEGAEAGGKPNSRRRPPRCLGGWRPLDDWTLLRFLRADVRKGKVNLEARWRG